MPTSTAVRARSTTPAKEQRGQVDDLNALKQDVKMEQQRRSIIYDFVTSQLTEGTDYGRIQIGGREAKPTLFKPGMEKIFSLFQIVSKIHKDEDTLSMINTQNVVAYKCELYRNGQFIGEGRGACSVSEKGRVNDVIKIAEKRARMDACLNLGFSEYFTQDLEDYKVDGVQQGGGQTQGQAEVSQETESEQPAKKEFVTLEFTVNDKQDLTSQSGNPYSRMQTDKGTVIAFKNTMDRFTEGGTYLAGGLFEERNGTTAFVVTSPGRTVGAVEDEEESMETDAA